MDIGALMFQTDLSMRTDRLAQALEERGLGADCGGDHGPIRTSRRTPWPGGAPLPEEYRRALDPFVALMAAAAATTRLRVGTGICLVAQHHPLTLAKTVASLDLMSDGRLLFGIGVGWNEDEMEHHGIPPARRRAVVRESMLAMRELWTKDEASFDGEFVKFSPSWSYPKPVQAGGPPVLMGGAGGPVDRKSVVEG